MDSLTDLTVLPALAVVAAVVAVVSLVSAAVRRRRPAPQTGWTTGFDRQPAQPPTERPQAFFVNDQAPARPLAKPFSVTGETYAPSPSTPLPTREQAWQPNVAAPIDLPKAPLRVVPTPAAPPREDKADHVPFAVHNVIALDEQDGAA